jgi:hypothetical protein
MVRIKDGRRGKDVRQPTDSRSERESAISWPKGVRRAAGAFPDFPDVEEIRSGYGKDRHREPLK